MKLILQNAIPPEMAGDLVLPGVAPCGPDDWLRVDDAYGAQMRYKAKLLGGRPADVLWMDSAAFDAASEMLDETLALLPALGFDVATDAVQCPDGRKVVVDRQHPLRTLGALVQEDVCILQKRRNEHALTGAVLCFPANWRLHDKAGRGLDAIHGPVAEYDADITRRVQRLFDGVRAGRPLWRFNRLTYRDADLHQPQRKDDAGQGDFIRSERQCILRLPKTQAVVFTIHTYVVRADGQQC